MSDFLKKYDYDFTNLGGLKDVQLIPISVITSFGEIINGRIYSIIINGDLIVPAIISNKSKFTEEKTAKSAFLYKMEFACSKDSLSLRNDFEILDNEKYVIVCSDNNGIKRILGSLLNPIIILTKLDKGENPSNLNYYNVEANWLTRERAAFADQLEITLSDSGLVWSDSNPLVLNENDEPIVYVAPEMYSTKRPFQLTEKTAAQIDSDYKIIIDKEDQNEASAIKISEINKIFSYELLKDLPTPITTFSIPIFFSAIYHQIEIIHEAGLYITEIIYGHAVTLQYSIDEGLNWILASVPLNISQSSSRWRVTSFGSFDDGAIILKNT